MQCSSIRYRIPNVYISWILELHKAKPKVSEDLMKLIAECNGNIIEDMSTNANNVGLVYYREIILYAVFDNKDDLLMFKLKVD